MTTVYVDPRQHSAGSGTRSDPFASLALANNALSKEPGSAHRVRMRAGTITREVVPEPLSSTYQVALHMDVYGGDKPATIDATTAASFWAQEESSGLWCADLGTETEGDEAGRKTIGALMRNGACLRMLPFNADLSALAEALTPGAYAYDWSTGLVYVNERPDVRRDVWRAATESYVLKITANGPYTLDDDPGKWNKQFEGIVFVGGKRHGILHSANKGAFDDCQCLACGGQQQSPEGGGWLGNGLEIAINARLVRARRCLFEQCFDAGATAQTYGVGQLVDDVLFEDCTARACGLFGFEISVQAGDANTQTTNIVLRRNIVEDAFDSFAFDVYAGRYGGIAVINNASGKLDEISIYGNRIRRVNGGIYVSRSGEWVPVVGNLLLDCRTSGLSNTVTEGAAPTRVGFIGNIAIGCKQGLKIEHHTDAARALVRGNVIAFNEVGVLNASTVPGTIENAENNTLLRNGTDYEGIE